MTIARLGDYSSCFLFVDVFEIGRNQLRDISCLSRDIMASCFATKL